MCSTLRSLSIVCSVAVLAVSTVALACPKDKQVVAQSTCGSQQTAVVQVANTEASTGCPKAAATKQTMALLAKAIASMPDDAARADVINAYRTLAMANGDLVCEKQANAVKAIAIGSGHCGQAQATAVALKTDAASGCCAAKAAKAKAAQAKNATVAKVDNAPCDPAACAAKIAAGKCDPAECAAKRASGECNPANCPAMQAKHAKYVAFGCEKTDRLARAAAMGYLQIMRELKAYTGAEVCPAATAEKLLAQVIEEEQMQANADVNVEVVSNVETQVSLGAVSEKKSSCGSKN